MQTKKLQLNALKLNDVISDAALSSKLTGEEYSSVKTKHHSLLLGKHELHEMSSLQVRDEDSYFVFPEFSDDMTKRVFGEATNVHVQVMCEFNHQNEQILYLRYRYLNLIISLSILREVNNIYFI